MIAARLQNDLDTRQSLLLVLEPGNIEKMRLGQPVIKKVNDFIPDLPFELELVLCFSPDVEWVSAQMKHGKDLAEAIVNSLTRDEVFIRGGAAEQMVAVMPTQTKRNPDENGADH